MNSTSNASCFQYGCPPPPPGRLPETGFDMTLAFVWVGLAALIIGICLLRWSR